MGRIKLLRIENYRSIGEKILINFPEKVPLVLVGENNAGKSNIVRALDLLLGEMWPGSHEPEDHEYHGRDKDNSPIEIMAEVEEVTHSDWHGVRDVARFIWRYPSGDEHGPFRIGFSGGEEKAFVSNDTREQCTCIVVGADRRLSYQLSYSSKYTLLSKLMRNFHQALTADPTRVQELKRQFDDVKTLFQSVAPFAAFTEELGHQVDELSGNLEYGLGIDFSAYDPSNYFHALRVHPYEGSDVRTFEELGTGQEQILALAFAHAYARAFRDSGGLLLVIEEPEAHLHPLAQEWVARKIQELASEGVQVVVTTHSPAFLDVLSLEGLVLVRKEAGDTRIVQLIREKLAQHCREKGAVGATAETILPFYGAAATQEILSGFFARKVVLVEGPTESMALPALMRRLPHGTIDTVKDGVAVIPVHGKGNLPRWWRLFTAYGIPTYVIFDNDREDDPKGVKRSDMLTSLGIPRDSFDYLLGTEDWVVESEFCIFGENYESTMRRYFGDAYTQLEEEARDQLGLGTKLAKPLIARYVAEHLKATRDASGSQKLVDLIESIRTLGSKPDWEDIPF